MSCGTPAYPNGIRDGMGNYIGLLINGTDESVGIVNMAALPGDYTPTFSGKQPDSTFRIAVEAHGIIEVELADGTDFTITDTMATKYEGDWLPLNIKRVYKNGTAGTFSVGW